MTKSTITIRREDTKVILTVDGRESIKECFTAVEASLMYDIYKAKIELTVIVDFVIYSSPSRRNKE